MNLVEVRTPVKRLARGTDAPVPKLIIPETSDNYSQHELLTIQAKHQETPLVHHVVTTIEKTYSNVEPRILPPLDTTLKGMHETSPTDCPTYRFKEWTWHDKSGLEFTLAAIIPSLPPSIVLGKVEPEDTKVAMILCITANQIWQQYGVTSPLGDEYHPTTGWWLLVTSLDETSPVNPETPLTCLENLRTLVEFEFTLCFHLANIYRGKFLIQHWSQLLAVTFYKQNFPYWINTLYVLRYVTVLEALSVVHDWSYTNMDNRQQRNAEQYGKTAKPYWNPSRQFKTINSPSLDNC